MEQTLIKWSTAVSQGHLKWPNWQPENISVKYQKNIWLFLFFLVILLLPIWTGCWLAKQVLIPRQRSKKLHANQHQCQLVNWPGQKMSLMLRLLTLFTPVSTYFMFPLLVILFCYDNVDPELDKVSIEAEVSKQQTMLWRQYVTLSSKNCRAKIF